MSNCKEVYIEAVLPFDWASHLTDQEARVWCAWGIGPHAFNTRYEGAPGISCENGGFLTRYKLVVEGSEAISDKALVILADSLRKQEHAEVIAQCRDIENDTDWWEIQTTEEYEAMCERVHQQVEEMMQGRHWETVTLSNGITTSTLVDD